MTVSSQAIHDEQLRLILDESTVAFTPCGDGEMVIRTWKQQSSSATLRRQDTDLIVLLHGGAGSWMHWAKNIQALRGFSEVVIPDLPGLGESAAAPSGADPFDVAEIVADGLQRVLGNRRFHLIGFSWGSVVSAIVAGRLESQVKSIMIVGPASTGKLPGQPRLKSLVPRSSAMSASQISAVNKENLARLMMFDVEKIDSMAIELHNINTKAARYNSPKFARGDYLLQGLSRTSSKLLVIYGDQDAVSVPFIDIRKQQLFSARPDLQFELVEQVGHWVQYESPDWFNHRVAAWVDENKNQSS